MAMGRCEGERQMPLWIAGTDLPSGPGHPFYKRLDTILAKHGFDRFVEDLCAPYYAEKMGRPSIPPGVYFRMLMVGYFEGIDSERGIAWRCADSIARRRRTLNRWVRSTRTRCSRCRNWWRTRATTPTTRFGIWGSWRFAPTCRNRSGAAAVGKVSRRSGTRSTGTAAGTHAARAANG